jgi:hypothetical protein
MAVQWFENIRETAPCGHGSEEGGCGLNRVRKKSDGPLPMVAALLKRSLTVATRGLFYAYPHALQLAELRAYLKDRKLR